MWAELLEVVISSPDLYVGCVAAFGLALLLVGGRTGGDGR